MCSVLAAPAGFVSGTEVSQAESVVAFSPETVPARR